MEKKDFGTVKRAGFRTLWLSAFGSSNNLFFPKEKLGQKKGGKRVSEVSFPAFLNKD